MNNPFLMNILQAHNNTRYNKLYDIKTITYLRLAKALLITDVVSQVCPSEIVHGEVQVLWGLERWVHVDQEWVVEGAENVQGGLGSKRFIIIEMG